MSEGSAYALVAAVGTVFIVVGSLYAWLRKR
jgi:hypothetical protein